jgi:transposase
MDLRELNALQLAACSRITFDGSRWLVPSQTTNEKYRVTIGPAPSCSCEDFLLRQQPCKHILAARFVCTREHDGIVPQIASDAVPKKPTQQRDWSAYNEAQMTEKHRFQALLFDLCRGIQEPPAAKTGRQRTPMPDRIFAAALKVYSTFSSRRFACDLKEAHDRGYLSKLMNSVSVNAYLECDLMTPVLNALIVRSSLPLKAVESVFAPDSSGFSASRFVRWHEEKYGARSGKDWVKAHAICGVKTNIVTAVVVAGRDAADSPQFKALVEKTAEHFTVKEVPADKAYLSHDNLELVEKLGGTAYVPFKCNSTAGEAGSLWEKMFHYYHLRRDDFLKHYHQRSNAETTFSMLKAKFRDHVRSRSEVAMKNEVLCKFLCHNICVVNKSHIDLGITAAFWPDELAETFAATPPPCPSETEPREAK